MGSLNKKLDISLASTAAASALPSNSSQAGLLDYDLGGKVWDAEAAFLLYSETDGRVSAIAPALQLTRNIDTDETLTLRLPLDALTGASPDGAVPSNNPQTFTGPSGNGAYSVAPGNAPLDEYFKDTRASFNVGWSRPLPSNFLLTLAANASSEYDYFSMGGSASLAREFNTNNTTLSAGISLSNDTVSPVGGVPTAFAAIPVANEEDVDDNDRNANRDEKKNITDVLFGVTQITDRDSVLQLSLGPSPSDGYQNDPYKILSAVDANGDPILADSASNLSLALYENRPESRTRQSVYAQYKRNIEGSVFNTSYRYMQDDWRVKSHTLVFSYRMPLGGGWCQPRLRYYTQQAAEFYTPFFKEGEQPAAETPNYLPLLILV